MNVDLTDTNASQIASALIRARRAAGSPAMGMVLTLIVVTDDDTCDEAMRAAAAVTTEHPARILGALRQSARGRARLDAEVRIGNNSAGEAVLLRMSGELVRHAESVVLPLLLPDSPVVVWWPRDAPEDVAHDPLGNLGQRRITDSANTTRSTRTALRTQAKHYAAGNTDLAWTRLTPWRALLAAALDQHPVTVTGAEVEGERGSPSADLMAAWLQSRLRVRVDQRSTSGPGLTRVRLLTRHGDIAISRPSGHIATFTIPGEADRPVALKRREIAELIAEELRRLDEDDVFAQTIKTFIRRQTAAKSTKTVKTGKQ